MESKPPQDFVSYYVPSIYRRPFPPQDYRHKTESEKVNYDTSKAEE
jgi:hypothetical protein